MFAEIRDEILFIEYKENLVITKDVAIICLSDRLKITDAYGKNIPLVANFKNIRSTTKDARDWFSRPESYRGLTCGAFIIKSSLARFVLSFFLNFSKSPIPSKVFNDTEAAVIWASNFKQLIVRS